VAETGGTIYMIETKKEADIETSDVQKKIEGALLYCKNAALLPYPAHAMIHAEINSVLR
jgi:hypothetical protein